MTARHNENDYRVIFHFACESAAIANHLYLRRWVVETCASIGRCAFRPDHASLERDGTKGGGERIGILTCEDARKRLAEAGKFRVRTARVCRIEADQMTVDAIPPYAHSHSLLPSSLIPTISRSRIGLYKPGRRGIRDEGRKSQAKTDRQTGSQSGKVCRKRLKASPCLSAPCKRQSDDTQSHVKKKRHTLHHSTSWPSRGSIPGGQNCDDCWRPDGETTVGI